MPVWIENILRGRVSTANVIAVILTLAYMYDTTFVVTYVLFHASKLDKELLTVIKDIMTQHREIIMLLVAYMIGNKTSQKTEEK